MEKACSAFGKLKVTSLKILKSNSDNAYDEMMEGMKS